MQVKIKAIENGKIPEYKTDGSAGADCFARLNERVIVKPGENITIPLGFAVEIPEGYEMQVRGRSGFARKNGIECFLGTIDSDYRGEVAAILFNKGNEDFVVHNGDRIAQAVIAPVVHASWILSEGLSETKRGEGGFGSTGVSENKEIEMSYPHNFEKFYEPFKTIGDADEVIAKEVIIDGKYKAIVESIFFKDTAIGKKPFITFRYKAESGKESIITDDMDFVTAFARVTIDGHRFGKEMEMKGGEK